MDKFIKGLFLLAGIFVVILCSTDFLLSEEITLKTIMPLQDTVRVRRGVVGAPDFEHDGVRDYSRNNIFPGGTHVGYDYQHESIPDDVLVVGKSIGIGTSYPYYQLHIYSEDAIEPGVPVRDHYTGIAIQHEGEAGQTSAAITLHSGQQASADDPIWNGIWASSTKPDPLRYNHDFHWGIGSYGDPTGSVTIYTFPGGGLTPHSRIYIEKSTGDISIGVNPAQTRDTEGKKLRVWGTVKATNYESQDGYKTYESGTEYTGRTQDVSVTDGGAGIITLHFKNGLFTGYTGGGGY